MSVKNKSRGLESRARHREIGRASVGLVVAAVGGVLVAAVLGELMVGNGSRTRASASSARDLRVAPAVTEAPTAFPPATLPSVPPPARLPGAATPPAAHVPTAAVSGTAEVDAPTAAPGVSFASRDGATVFTVPSPGDPEYADYTEMLQHPRFRSALEGLPGYALPYDPEWRSVIQGKRKTAPTPLQFEGGAGSLAALANAYLQAIGAGDEIAVLRLRISRDEFERILWPEFPQSRPYLRIKPEDAWSLHHANSMSGVLKALEEQAGRKLDLVDIEHGDVVEYTNFTLYRDVLIRVRDAETQRIQELPYLPVVVRRNGKFKAYLYRS